MSLSVCDVGLNLLFRLSSGSDNGEGNYSSDAGSLFSLPPPLDTLRFLLERRDQHHATITIVEPEDFKHGFEVAVYRQQDATSLEVDMLLKEKVETGIHKFDYHITSEHITDHSHNLLFLMPKEIFQQLVKKHSWVKDIEGILSCAKMDEGPTNLFPDPTECPPYRSYGQEYRSIGEAMSSHSSQTFSQAFSMSIVWIHSLNRDPITGKIPEVVDSAVLSAGLLTESKFQLRLFNVLAKHKRKCGLCLRLTQPLNTSVSLWFRIADNSDVTSSFPDGCIYTTLEAGATEVTVGMMANEKLEALSVIKIDLKILFNNDYIQVQSKEMLRKQQDIEKLIKNSDQVTVAVGSRSLRFPKAIAIAKSGYFKALYDSNCEESKSNKVIFNKKDFTISLLKQLIDYTIYGQICKKYLSVNLHLMYEAACYFDIPSLSTFIFEAIDEPIPPETLFRLLVSANNHGDEVTKNRARSVLSKLNQRDSTLWESAVKDHPQLVLETLNEWTLDILKKQQLLQTSCYKLAKKYEDILLYHLCHVFTSEKLNARNLAREKIVLPPQTPVKALTAILIAEAYKDAELKELAMRYIINNYRKVQRLVLWKNDIAEHPTLLAEIVCRESEVNRMDCDCEAN